MRWLVLVLVMTLLSCEREAEVPFKPPAIPLTSMNAREQAEFFAQAGILADNRVKTFTPTWSGFSVDPDGDISYMDFGPVVMMWVDVATTGTSDAAQLEISDLPASIRPNGNARDVVCLVINDSTLLTGSAAVGSNGIITFYIARALGVDSSLIQTSTWTASGNKGLPQGWFIIYPK